MRSAKQSDRRLDPEGVSRPRRDGARLDRSRLPPQPASAGRRYRRPFRALERGRKPAPAGAARETRHPAVHGRGTVSTGDLRLQAQARLHGRAADARFGDGRPADRAAPEHQARLPGTSVRLQEVRRLRTGHLHPLSVHGESGGLDLHHPIHADGADQPRPGTRFHEHRQPGPRPPEHGVVDALRAGQRERQPPRLRGHDHRIPHLDTADPLADVAERVSPQPLSGRSVPVEGEPGQLSDQPGGRRRRGAARGDRRRPRDQRARPRIADTTRRSQLASPSTRRRRACR